MTYGSHSLVLRKVSFTATMLRFQRFEQPLFESRIDGAEAAQTDAIKRSISVYAMFVDRIGGHYIRVFHGSLFGRYNYFIFSYLWGEKLKDSATQQRKQV